MCIKIALNARKRMNHCLLEAIVKVAPTLRYTQDNQTPIAEMEVAIAGLRAEDPPGPLKVVGWGNLAQELQSRVQVGQKLILEGRLRMNTVPKQDGTKEKKAEFTLSKMHPIAGEESFSGSSSSKLDFQGSSKSSMNTNPTNPSNSNDGDNSVTWDSSPLIPDTDDIPF